jgi:MFS family permease
MSVVNAFALDNRALSRLIGGHVCLHACMAGMRMAAPLLALRSGHSAASVGMLLALFALTQVFLALPAGRYVDRHGYLKPVRFCLAASVLGAFLAAAWPVFGVLCLSALLTGGAVGVGAISLQRYVGRCARNALERKRLFSWLSIGPAMSNFVGPLLVGVVIDLAGFQMAFAVLALLPVLAWQLVHTTRELSPVPVDESTTKRRVWDLLKQSQMRRLLLVNWLMSSCWDVHTFVVPVLGHERNLSASAIGAILGGFAFAATAVRVVLPWIAAKLQERMVITIAMLATSCLFGVYPLIQSAWGMGLCSAMLGLSLGSVQPMIMSTLHHITPESRHGEAIGLRLMLINASSVGMPMLFGAAGAVAGISVVFWTVGAVVGLGSRQAWGLQATGTYN